MLRSYSFTATTANSVMGDTGDTGERIVSEEEGDTSKPIAWNSSSGLKSGVVCRSTEDGSGSGGGGGGGCGGGVGGGNGVVCSLFLCFLCFFFSCTPARSMGFDAGSTVTVAMMKKDARTL